ncbi:MAG: heavy-metal-associated domain-containing protein, partial [Armatimonadetes bacterium]|nr:heavy-metal-associated domain-containing protein [Armatimonadota bacterium]
MPTWETKTLHLPVLLPSGRECALCITRLRDSLLQMAGVEAAEVDASRSRLVLTYDPSLLTLDRVER